MGKLMVSWRPWIDKMNLYHCLLIRHFLAIEIPHFIEFYFDRFHRFVIWNFHLILCCAIPLTNVDMLAEYFLEDSFFFFQGVLLNFKFSKFQLERKSFKWNAIHVQVIAIIWNLLQQEQVKTFLNNKIK